MDYDPDDTESADGADPGSQWRFDLDDVDEDGIVSTRVTIEPGKPNPEHVLFVVLGVLSTILLVVSLVYF